MDIFSYAQEGYHGHIVRVEVDIRRGIPGILIIGLPLGAVREAKDRVRIAIKNSGYEYPASKIVVNLAPGDIQKRGVNYDLAIAYALLGATHQLSPNYNFSSVLLLGELYLNGQINKIPAVVSAIDEGYKQGITNFIVPYQNYQEAKLLKKGNIIPVNALDDFRKPSNNFGLMAQTSTNSAEEISKYEHSHIQGDTYSIDTLIGMSYLKRGIEIAAAGAHHLFLVGPPGCGKTLSTKCIPDILPQLPPELSIEVTRIYSLLNQLSGCNSLINSPPFRTPHQSISYAGMIGGGPNVLPGEIVKSHNGILLLDEILEFKRDVLQALRQPLEDKTVSIIRAENSIMYPCNFQLLMTANACPCANLGSNHGLCFCSKTEIINYWKKLGSAFLDRIPIRIAVSKNSINNRYDSIDLSKKAMRKRIKYARRRQYLRYRDNHSIRHNSDLRGDTIKHYLPVTSSIEELCNNHNIRDKLAHISMRAKMQILCVALTIADLSNSAHITTDNILEAIDFHTLSTFLPAESPMQPLIRFVN